MPEVSWLFFKARVKRPYASHTGRSAAAEEKQPTGPGPKGCDENGLAAALLVGHVSIQICSLLPPVRLGPPCRRPILIATIYLLFRGQDTRFTLLSFCCPVWHLADWAFVASSRKVLTFFCFLVSAVGKTQKSGLTFPFLIGSQVRSIPIATFVIFVLAVSWIAAQQNSPRDRLYHCPMHPDYVADKAGRCPICGMELVPVERGPSNQIVRQERVPVEIRPEQQRVLGIAVSEVATVPMERTIRAVGHVSMAPPSRMPAPEEGIVQEIYQNPGPAGALRLRTNEPILSLSAPPGTVIVRAPGPLVLISVPPPGFKVEKGKDLCMYIDLSTIFVLADVRSTDIPFIRTGLAAKAILPAYPGRIWQGNVVEASQQFDERTQTLKVKLQFRNDLPEIWQGMLANIELASPIGPVLAVPESAVIADGDDTVVFVAKPGDVFEPRRIETGLRANSFAEVKRGLSVGERVVTAATFLLDSESRLRALVQTVNRH